MLIAWHIKNFCIPRSERTQKLLRIKISCLACYLAFSCFIQSIEVFKSSNTEKKYSNNTEIMNYDFLEQQTRDLELLEGIILTLENNEVSGLFSLANTNKKMDHLRTLFLCKSHMEEAMEYMKSTTYAGNLLILQTLVIGPLAFFFRKKVAEYITSFPIIAGLMVLLSFFAFTNILQLSHVCWLKMRDETHCQEEDSSESSYEGENAEELFKEMLKANNEKIKKDIIQLIEKEINNRSNKKPSKNEDNNLSVKHASKDENKVKKVASQDKKEKSLRNNSRNKDVFPRPDANSHNEVSEKKS